MQLNNVILEYLLYWGFYDHCIILLNEDINILGNADLSYCIRILWFLEVVVMPVINYMFNFS